MRTTLEFPDAFYRKLKMRAASEGTTVKRIVLDAVAARLDDKAINTLPRKRGKFPSLKSTNPGSLKLSEEGVYDYIPFP